MSGHNEDRALGFAVGGAIGAALIAAPGLLLPAEVSAWLYVVALGAGAGWGAHIATKEEDVAALGFERHEPHRTDRKT